jgi:hypothetical protein
MTKIFTGVQGVSNFRPTASWAIYEYAYSILKKPISTWDMSGGFGGRLLGAILNNNVVKYTATDPSTETFGGLNSLARDFGNKPITLIRRGSETDNGISNVNLCFTSPPYFNTEKYADEPTQSYLKYDTKKDWFDNFLIKTIDNCYEALDEQGLLIINIANIKGFDIADKLNNYLGKSQKWQYKDYLHYSLSSISKKSTFKYEPVFVYQKVS